MDVQTDAMAIALRLAGPTNFRAVITTSYRDENALELDSSTSRRSINTVSLDDEAGQINHALTIPDDTAQMIITVRGGTVTGGDLALDCIGNTITLTVDPDP